MWSHGSPCTAVVKHNTVIVIWWEFAAVESLQHEDLSDFMCTHTVCVLSSETSSLGIIPDVYFRGSLKITENVKYVQYSLRAVSGWEAVAQQNSIKALLLLLQLLLLLLYFLVELCDSLTMCFSGAETLASRWVRHTVCQDAAASSSTLIHAQSLPSQRYNLRHRTHSLYRCHHTPHACQIPTSLHECFIKTSVRHLTL